MITVSAFLLLTIPALVLGHSWIACSKYDGDLFRDGRYREELCRGFVRNWAADNNGRGFGMDNLQFNTFDLRGGRNPSQAVCRGSKGQAYPGNFPAASYRRGESIRIVWPAKNHGGPAAGRGCNDNHPDRTDVVFAYCGNQRDPSFQELNSGNNPNRIADLKANGGRGFKNCVNFCSDTDKAACQGDFVIPNSLSGRCTFIWLWELNQGEFYTSCWEGDIVDGGASVPNPTPASTSVTVTAAPAPAAAAGRFVRLNRSPSPIPANGVFEVEVQWSLTGLSGPKTVVLDILKANFEYLGRGFQLEERDSNTNKFQVSTDAGKQFVEGEEALLKMYVVRRDVWNRDPNNAWREVEVEGFARVRASFGGRRTLDVEEVSLSGDLSSWAVVGLCVAGVAVVAVAAVVVVAVVRARKAVAVDHGAHMQMVDSAAL